MTDFFNRLEGVRARWNVLNHSFYQRWSEGTLSRDELARYAGEYRHVVVALADAAAGAARAADPKLRAQLEAHAAEEASHIPLWDGFARAVGGDPATQGGSGDASHPDHRPHRARHVDRPAESPGSGLRRLRDQADRAGQVARQDDAPSRAGAGVSGWAHCRRTATEDL